MYSELINASRANQMMMQANEDKAELTKVLKFINSEILDSCCAGNNCIALCVIDKPDLFSKIFTVNGNLKVFGTKLMLILSDKGYKFTFSGSRVDISW